MYIIDACDKIRLGFSRFRTVVHAYTLVNAIIVEPIEKLAVDVWVHNKFVGLFSALGIAGFFLLSHSLAGAEDLTKPDFEIPKTHIEVRVLPKDQVPKTELSAESFPAAASSDKPEDPLVALRQEVETLRDELRLLQSTLDLLINQVVEDLRSENEFLRNEVHRLTRIQRDYGLPDPTVVPRPGIDILRDVLESQRAYEGESVASSPSLPKIPLSPPPEANVPEDSVEKQSFTFTVIHEWGRTPEVAKELGDDVPSLKGIVGLVPPRSSREDIETLGRELRNKYAAYDNINIEVFDDREAAELFIETEVGHPDHRVLSISKHAASQRDVILYLEKGKAYEVTP